MTPRQRIEAQTLALAGVLQATFLVDRIARTGQVDTASFNGILHSLFVFDPDTPQDVYNGSHNLQLGLRVLRDVLSGQGRGEYHTCVRYALGILHLQKKLAENPQMQTTIRNRLQHTEKKLEHFTQDINDIAGSIAAIYQDTISNFKYRIQVTGSLQQLQNSANADRIRALLLAAVRSAVLWRQVGGKRWHLLVLRRRLLQTAAALIQR
jgi:high frequency lysogenization protein